MCEEMSSESAVRITMITSVGASCLRSAKLKVMKRSLAFNENKSAGWLYCQLKKINIGFGLQSFFHCKIIAIIMFSKAFRNKVAV